MNRRVRRSVELQSPCTREPKMFRAPLLFSAALLLVVPSAFAGDRLAALESASLAPPAAGSAEDSIYEVPAPPVVIEGELPHHGPTPQELLEHFRESLKAPPSYLSTERRLADGTIEASTRIGRFCSPPVPAQPISGVGGDIRLISPCASF